MPPTSHRRPELDALRGLFLVWMTLTHLPTRVSDFVNQPFGFLSSAEGFVFLSSLLVSQIYARLPEERRPAMRITLWKRSLRLYGYHLLMLAMAFTAGALLAVSAHKIALHNLLNFYLAHPTTAIIGSIFLIYCPPLLDILPIYILYLAITPSLLNYAHRRGWTRILWASWIVWALAQVGLRSWIHTGIVAITHLQIPLQETGAFNLFAWQWVWIMGLWIGTRSQQGLNPLARIPRSLVLPSSLICLFFLGVRHSWWGPHLTQQVFGLWLDKWQIGPLRVMNLIAFSALFYWLRHWALRLVQVEPFLTLGRASLEVFCVHILFVFVGLSLLYQDTPILHGAAAIALLSATFSGLILVAIREVRNRERKRQHNDSGPPSTPPASSGPGSTASFFVPAVVPPFDLCPGHTSSHGSQGK